MTELVPLRRQVVRVVIAGVDFQRNPFHNLKAISAEPGDLAGVVGQQPQTMNSEIGQDLCPDPVVAEISRKTKLFIGFHGVQSAVLEAVSLEFVDQTDPPAFLS